MCRPGLVRVALQYLESCFVDLCAALPAPADGSLRMRRARTSCEERYCRAAAAERRSLATRTSRSRVDFLLCADHDAALERGAAFEVVLEHGPDGWEQYIVIWPR